MHFYVHWMSTLRKARLQSRRVEKLPANTRQAGRAEFDVGDLNRRTGDKLGATVYPPEQRPSGPLAAKLQSEIDQWSAIIKKTGVYAD